MSSFLDSLTVHSLTGLLSALIIPCVAIVAGLSFAAYSMYLRVRAQREALQMHHAERLAAIEKGIELPPLPSELLHDRYYGVGYRGEYRHWRRASGLTLVIVGAAVTVAMWQMNGDNSFWWGVVIIAWGVGRLVGEHLEGGRAFYNPPGTPPQGGNGGAVPPGSNFNR